MVDVIVIVFFGWFLSLILFIPLSFFLKIKLPFLKNKYKNKVDPIYKLEKEEWDSYYRVYKYELGWVIPDDLPWYYIVFPVCLIFPLYRYVRHCESWGRFVKEQIIDENFTIEDLSKYWEESYFDAKMEHHAHNIEINQFNSKLDDINQEFIENYE
jgi:hypothetical protein